MVQVVFSVKQLPDRCSDRLSSNASELEGKVLGLTRVPCLGEWVEFHGIFYQVVQVRHTPIGAHRDAVVEVTYCGGE